MGERTSRKCGACLVLILRGGGARIERDHCKFLSALGVDDRAEVEGAKDCRAATLFPRV